MLKIVVSSALVLAACGKDVAEKAPSAETPSEFAERFATALNEQDWGALYDNLCKRNREQMDRGLSANADDESDLAHSARRDRWVREFATLIRKGRRIAGEGPYRVTRIRHPGGEWAAAAIQTGPSGDIETIQMVRENSHWRLIFFGPGHGGGMTWGDDRWWLPR